MAVNARRTSPISMVCAGTRAISDAQTVQVKEVLRVSCSGSLLERCGTSERRMSVYRILILVCTRAHIELPLPCPEDVRYGFTAGPAELLARPSFRRRRSCLSEGDVPLQTTFLA